MGLSAGGGLIYGALRRVKIFVGLFAGGGGGGLYAELYGIF